MFKFGAKLGFVFASIDEARIEEAMQSLTSLFGENALKG